MSGENVTGWTNTTANPGDWKTVSIVLQVCNLTLMAITLWLWGCMIIYGAKTGRFRKRPQGSSLNSGRIYVACILAVTLFFPKLVTVELLYSSPYIWENKAENRCEILAGIDNGAYAVATFSTYFFLWLKQRLIYKHPYVKQRIGKCSNWISRLFLLVLIIVTAVLLYIFLAHTDYEKKPQGCIIAENERDNFMNGTGKNIILAVAMLILQVTILIICIYPAVRVQFESSGEVDEENQTNEANNESYGLDACFQYMFAKRSGKTGPISPIEMSVRRTMASCIFIVISNIITLAVSAAVLGSKAPVVLRQTIYNFGLFINVICILYTFGFAVKVVTLCCPTCPKRRKMKFNNNNKGIPLPEIEDRDETEITGLGLKD